MMRFETVVGDLAFPECPRWRGDTLWFVDVADRRVLALRPGATLEQVAAVDWQPGGLGFARDGAVVAVSMLERRLVRLEGGQTSVVADLSGLAARPCNDMVVDREGRAYVGCVGVPFAEYNTGVGAGSLLLVDPDGTASVVATGVSTPNGCVVTAEGDTLIVAESIAERLSAFDIAPDGSLGARRTFCELGCHCDGICLDARGSVWVSSPRTDGLLKVDAAGGIVERIETERSVVACALGGEDGRTLYVCSVASMSEGDRRTARSGRIEAARVDVPGVEMP
jgi:sugar lactone lactonase YvrE